MRTFAQRVARLWVLLRRLAALELRIEKAAAEIERLEAENARLTKLATETLAKFGRPTLFRVDQCPKCGTKLPFTAN